MRGEEDRQWPGMDDDGFRRWSIETGGRRIPVAEWLPQSGSAGEEEGLPLIVFLHGRGECGADGQAQCAVGLGPVLMARPELYPARVLLPQKPDPEQEWEDLSDALEAMLSIAMRDGAIDRSRVSLTGVSQGGHGVWAMHALLPGVFSALAPVCGYTERRFGDGEARVGVEIEAGETTARMADAAAGMPVWMFHGDADGPIPVRESRRMEALLRDRGGDVRLTVYPGVEHNCWDLAYAEEGLGTWMVAQRLG